MPSPDKEFTSDEITQVLREGLLDFNDKVTAAQPRPVPLPVVSPPITDSVVMHEAKSSSGPVAETKSQPANNAATMEVYGMFNGGFALIEINARFV